MRRFLLVFTAALVAAGAAAADTRRAAIDPGWSDYEPVWSPGGRMILFSSGYEPAKSAPTFRLGLVPPGGGAPRFLSKPSPRKWSSEETASWSPEGNRLLITRRLDDVDWHVVVVVRDLVTGAEKQLTRTAARERAVERGGNWSRDGRRVVFVRGEESDKRSVVTARPDGSAETILTSSGSVGRAEFIGDGSRVAFMRYRSGGGGRVVTIAAGGGDEHPVTDWAGGTALDWTRDGKTVLLLRGEGTQKEELWSAGIAGSALRRLAEGNEGAWSPDGSRVVFSCCSPYVDLPRSRRGIFVVAADGSGLRRLRATGAAPRFSPDGRSIAFHDFDDPNPRNACHGTAIFVAPSTGGRARKLTNECRLRGTSRDDVLLGTNDRDIVYGLAGDDVIRANPGDRMKEYYGRDDNDIVDGGPGNDRIYGARHSDRLSGGPGNDRIFGGDHTDYLLGGAGDDYLSAGDGDERIVAGSGSDTILVRDRNRDTVSCGPGRDIVAADQRDLIARDCEVVRRSRT